jgi:tetratricopeptide (TPR) repeat protein
MDGLFLFGVDVGPLNVMDGAQRRLTNPLPRAIGSKAKTSIGSAEVWNICDSLISRESGLTSAFIAIPGRDASAVIRGFVFQANLTILRWLELPENSRLELEFGEDIDTVQDGSPDGAAAEKRVLEQLKVRDTRSLTLRSVDALQSLANYCLHRLNNPAVDLQFRYVTTALAGKEQGWNRSEGAIETWMALWRGNVGELERDEAVAALLQFLRACKQPDKTSAEAWAALQSTLAWDTEQFLTAIVLPFEWGTGFGDYAKIESEILAALGLEPYAVYGTPEQIYEHLFAYVFRLLCQRGLKELTASRLADELHAPSIAPAERGILRLLRDELGQIKEDIAAVRSTVDQQMLELGALRQTVGLLGRSLGIEAQLALQAVLFSSDPPELLDRCAPRTGAVAELLALLEASHVVALFGEPGAGKTQLLLLTSAKLTARKLWLNIPREATEAQAGISLESFVRSIANTLEPLPFRELCAVAAQRLHRAVVILDDLPRVIPGGQFASRVEAFARALMAVDGSLFLASYFPLPATLATSIGFARYDVRRFEQEDVLELLAANDAPVHLCTEKVTNLLVTVAEGLPTLVMAAVRYLEGRSWALTPAEFEALFRGEFAEAHRHDAASLLHVIVPDQGERELLFRMSLAIGDFSIEDIAAVARIRKSIPLPGEKVTRATGVWLQRINEGRYTRSPLITAAMGGALDPMTRRAVHFVLALRILDRKALAPIEIFTCVNHLILAETLAYAAMVVIQALSSFLDMEETIEDDFGFSRMWASISFDGEIPLDLLLHLKALQIAVVAKQGRDFTAQLAQIDRMIGEAPKDSWGAAMASGTLAIYLVWLVPSLANQYLLESLKRVPTARLPDGSTFPVREYPLEMILWMSSYTGKSEQDADSWLATLAKLSPEQIATLHSSELMEDNVTILCDGIWRREYDKPEAERDWSRVAEKLKQVEATGEQVGFPLLAAAAIRTQIVVLAEWQHQLNAAVALSEAALARFDKDDSRFLLLEVTGRHLFYGEQPQMAMAWLEKALQCNAYHHSLWRRDVLITLAEIKGAQDPQAAVDLTAKAIDVAEGSQPYDLGIGEALAEHGIALWKAGNRTSAFAAFERAVNRFLASSSQLDLWKGSFYRLFAALVYFSDVMEKEKPAEGHLEPEQGRFLGSREAHPFYRDEQKSFICIRLAMFADGLRDMAAAATWTWRAVAIARECPTAWTATRLQSFLAMPAVLLANDFSSATELAFLMGEADPNELISRTKAIVSGTATDPSAKLAEIDPMVAATTPPKPLPFLLVRPFVPIAVRLTDLSLRAATRDEILGYLSDVEALLPADHPPRGFVADLRRTLIEDTDWQTMQQQGYDAVSANELVHGYVLCLGAMRHAPVPAALYLQAMLAEHLDHIAITTPSLYREVIAPLFRTYWEKTVDQSAAIFRTGLSYTKRQLELADGSAAGTRRLLVAMGFCLGLSFSEKMNAWLNS